MNVDRCYPKMPVLPGKDVSFDFIEFDAGDISGLTRKYCLRVLSVDTHLSRKSPNIDMKLASACPADSFHRIRHCGFLAKGDRGENSRGRLSFCVSGSHCRRKGASEGGPNRQCNLFPPNCRARTFASSRQIYRKAPYYLAQARRSLARGE